MFSETKGIIKIIGIYDLIIAIIISAILYLFGVHGFYFFPLGIVASFINFNVNSYTTHRTVMDKDKFKVLIILLSYAVRIGIVCIPAIALFKLNVTSFFTFIAGYSSQLIAIVLYGVSLGKSKGVD